MSGVNIKDVKSKRELRDFISIADKLYENCQQYVPDLHRDIAGTFNPRKNAALDFVKIKPMVAYKDGKPVGRIMGIINPHANEKWQTRVVRFGMIDFIDDPQVSSALIQAVEQWGISEGMDTIQGPLGITDFDKEGMLMSDYDKTGAMTEIYNYPYYPRHMELMGFGKAVDWIQIRFAVPEELPARFERVARLSKEMFGLHVRTMTKREVLSGYGLRVFHLLNEAYAPLFGFTGFTDRQADDFIRQYVPLIDLRMVPVVENDKGELVAVAVTMTSLSHALKRAKGKLWPTGWFWLLRTLKWKPQHTAGLLLIAVRPDYQGLGVNALIFDNLFPLYRKLDIRYAETGPQLEDNIKELSQWKLLHPQTLKRRRCWTKNIANN